MADLPQHYVNVPSHVDTMRHAAAVIEAGLGEVLIAVAADVDAVDVAGLEHVTDVLSWARTLGVKLGRLAERYPLPAPEGGEPQPFDIGGGPAVPVTTTENGGTAA